MSQAMLRLMTVTASTKRAVVSGSGVDKKYANPTTYIASLVCLPIDPVPLSEGSDPKLRNVLKAPVGLFETVVVGGQDIITGDTLTVGSQDYSIRMAEPWAASTNGSDAYMKLTLEKVKP